MFSTHIKQSGEVRLMENTESMNDDVQEQVEKPRSRTRRTIF